MVIPAKDWKGTASLGTVGLEVVVGLVLGLLLGRWLDGKFHTAPFLAIAGFVLGLVTAIKAIVRTWREMQRIAAREEAEQGNPAPMYEEPRKASKDDDFFGDTRPAETDDQNELKR